MNGAALAHSWGAGVELALGESTEDFGTNTGADRLATLRVFGSGVCVGVVNTPAAGLASAFVIERAGLT